MRLGEILNTAGVDAKYHLPWLGQADASTEVYVNGAPVTRAIMVRSSFGLNRLLLTYDALGPVPNDLDAVGRICTDSVQMGEEGE